MDKIKLETDYIKLNELLYNANNTAETFNSLNAYYQSIELNLPTETLKKLIERRLSPEVVQEYADTQFTEQNKYMAKSAREHLKADLMSYPEEIGNNISFEYVNIDKKGYAKLKDGANEEIAERCTTYLTDPKQIELFQRHERITKEALELAEELRAFNNTLFLSDILFDRNLQKNTYTNYGN